MMFTDTINTPMFRHTKGTCSQVLTIVFVLLKHQQTIWKEENI